MKKHFYLLMTLMMSFLSILRAQAQDITFIDPIFEAALLTIPGIDTDGDGIIQVDETAAYTGTLDVSNKGINDLAGIENFTALSQLNCSYNNLTTLDISLNTSLYNLDCQHNQLTDLTLNTYLDYLICNNNQLTSLDLSANTYLSTVVCYYNQLTTLFVSANPYLFSLGCGNNLLPSLDISSCTGLYLLDCTGNQLSSLDVSANTNLFGLYCNNNQLSSLDVSANTSLGIVSCQHNQLTSIDVSNNLALFALDVEANNITSIDVSINSTLENLNCGYNQLSTLNVSANTALRYLACHYNQISSLDISANTNLTQLGCNGNQLTSLDLSANSLLDDLGCSFNQLTTLDVSHNPAIISLFCNDNQLTSLDVSANTVLIQLGCFDNHLTSLNMKNGNNTNMNYFICWNNPDLSCIQVDDAAYMNALWGANKDETAGFSEHCGGCVTYFASLGLQTGSPSSICVGGSANLVVNITGAASSNTYFDIHFTDGSNASTRRVFVNGSNVSAAFSVSPTSTANYKLTSITDASGCSGLIGPATSDTFELVTVVLPPTITTNPAITTDLNSNITVRLTSSPASSFAWYRNNVSNNKTTRSITVNTEGSYTVVTTNLAAGCTNTSAPVIVSYLPCNAPSQITVSNITGTAGQVNFTTASNGITYELRYRQVKTGSSNTWTNTTGITTSPYTLTSLLPNSWYAVQMRTVCSTTKPTKFSAWVTSTPVNFKTLPQALTAESVIVNRVVTEGLYISLTPNPARSNAVLHISAKQVSVSVIITDMYGKILWQSQHERNKEINLPVQNLAAGMYIVSVSNGKETKVVKLVKG